MSSVSVNPYAAPEALDDAIYQAASVENSFPNEVWRDGKCLVVSKKANLPDICILTNEPTSGSRVTHPFAWTPSSFVLISLLLLIFVMPIGFLVCVLVGPFVSQRAKLKLPVCEKYAKRWQARTRIWLGSVTIAIASAAFCFLLITLAVDQNIASLVFLAGLSILGFGAIWAIIVGWKLKPARINKHYVWIKGVHPDYLARVPIIPVKI